MDISISFIIDCFIENFVLKEIREGSDLQLKSDKGRKKFTVGLNQQWEKIFDMRLISKIPSGVNDQEFVTKQLGIKNHDLWYIISNHSEIDGQITEFNVAFDKVHGRGFGSVIVNLSGDKLYLETELIQGKQNRFIGKLQS